ncbi:MAG: sugar phosphate isomerase/epimerase [Clostridia bacterium]|nr:sugar phosphate isomerase/epimerase [Clostridia bacterium]
MRISMELPLPVLMDDAALDKIAQAGIKDISVPFEFYDLEDAVIIERNRALNARGITIDTCHLPHGRYPDAKHSTCSVVPAVFEASLNMWLYYLNRFTLTGMRATPLHMSGCLFPSMPEAYREQLSRFLAAIAPAAEKAGVMVALENTFYHKKPEFTYTVNGVEDPHARANDDVDMIVALMETLDPKVFGLCFDIGHANLYGRRVMEDLEKMLPYVCLYHLHDNGGTSDDHYLPGLGNIPFGAFAQKVADHPHPMYAEVLKDPDPERQAWLFTAEGLIESFAVMHSALA